VPVILFGDLHNIYVQLMLFTTIWLGTVGFIDDYIKVFRKNKAGLRGTFKIIAQVVAGLVVGLTLHFNDNILVREKVLNSEGTAVTRIMEGSDQQEPSITYITRDVKSTRVNVPFFKDNEFDYAMLIGFLGEKARDWAWIVVIVAVILIITFISNGANLTDGLDGLAAGTSAIIGLTLGILAYVSGNVIFSDYLNMWCL
jgi:phospho-N-acetylmuramoyl-pentapeptide-transferase